MSKRKGRIETIGGGMFLIALGAIFYFEQISFWPWILAAIGVTQIPGLFFRRSMVYAWHTVIWMGGLAVLFHFGLFWPGVLFLAGASAIAFALVKEEKEGEE